MNVWVEMGSKIKKNSLVITSVVLSPKHGENEESIAKVWENKPFPGQVFLIYQEAKIHAVPKTQNMQTVNLLSAGNLWENTKGSKGFGFLYILHYSYFAWNRNPYNSENTGNNWILGKHKHSKVMGFLHISCVTLIHAIPKIWEKWIPKVRKKYGKTNISKLRISGLFSLKQKSMQFPKYGKSGFP